MATIDAGIYGGIRQFAMPDPIEQAGKAYALQNAALVNQDAQRKFTLEDDISKALADSGGDLSKASTALAAAGRGTAALQLRSKAQEQQKADLEQKLKLAEAMGADAIALDSVWRNALSQAGGDTAKALEIVNPVYAGVRQKWSGMGQSLPERFDPNANFAGIGQAKELTAYLKSLDPLIHMTDTGGTIVPTNTNPRAGPVGQLAGATPITKTAAPKAPDPTELSRLMTERDALPEGDPRRVRYDEVIKGYKAGKGDVGLTVNTGPMTPGKTAAGKVDEDLLSVTRNLMSLDNISGQFKPEFQRFQDKAGFAALSVKDSTVGLTNKEKSDLTSYAQYRRNAFNTLNEYIKSITGAAMSESEAARILKGMPNPGSGMFDGDSPTEFKAKLDDAIKSTKLAVARLSYIKRNGMSLEDGLGKGLTLDRMPALMNERAAALDAELRKTGADDKAVRKAVRRQLAVEFGLSSD